MMKVFFRFLFLFFMIPFFLAAQFKIKNRSLAEIKAIYPTPYGITYIGSGSNPFNYGYFSYLWSNSLYADAIQSGNIYGRSASVSVGTLIPEVSPGYISVIGLPGSRYDFGYFYNLDAYNLNADSMTIGKLSSDLSSQKGLNIYNGGIKYRTRFPELGLLTSATNDTVSGMVKYEGKRPYSNYSILGSASKRGGIILRGDDNGNGDDRAREIVKYIKAGMPFLWSINLGKGRDSKDFVELVNVMQSLGVELADHTPNHDVFYYVGEPKVLASTPGVKSVSGDTTYLEYVWDGSYNRMTVNATTLLLKASLYKWKKFGLTRPYVWIHPGSNPTYTVTTDTLKAAAEPLGYLSGATYVGYRARKTYAEEDSLAPWCMQWSDFDIATNTFASQKSLIVDGVARNNVITQGNNHFPNTETYLARVDSLIAFVQKNKIPVLSQQEWSNILYRTKADKYVNILPNLYNDIDHNNRPDGWNTIANWSKNVGVEEDNNHSLYVTSATQFFIMSYLGGVEKGYNSFSFWAKGANGTKLRAIFDPENPSTYKSDTLTFTLSGTGWEHFTESDSDNGNTYLLFDNSVVWLTVKMDVTAFLSDTVFVSGLELRKKRW